MSQSSLLLAWLKAGHEVTPMDALRMWGCFRLGARVYDLRRAGHNVVSEPRTCGRKRFAAYRMEGGR